MSKQNHNHSITLVRVSQLNEDNFYADNDCLYFICLLTITRVTQLHLIQANVISTNISKTIQELNLKIRLFVTSFKNKVVIFSGLSFIDCPFGIL